MLYSCFLSSKDKAVAPPSVTAYSPAEKHDKNTLLCQASGMFPDLVKFSWRTKSSSGDWADVSKEHFVEQRDEKKKEEVFVTSMMIVDKNAAKNNYQCSVEHEGKTQTRTIQVKPGNSLLHIY